MKLCLILNMAPHYRKGIFQLLDQEYDCTFQCGAHCGGIKPLDMSFIRGAYVEERRRTIFKKLIWQKGTVSAVKKDFDAYIITGDYRDISAWILLILGKLKKKDVYLWTHGWYGRESSLKVRVKKRFSSLASGEFVYGDYAKSVMVENGYNASRVHVIHNSLNYSVQLKEREECALTDIYRSHFNNDNKNILFIGRLTPVKQLDKLITAVAMLKDRGEDYNITLVGSGSVQPALEELAKTYQLENVWFTGPIYDEHAKAEIIFNADICVAPGNVGLTAIDSMMFGTPVATHNSFEDQMPEFETIEAGKTGFFFGKTPGSIASGLHDWFAANPDRDVIRHNCYEVIDNYWTPQYQLSVIKKTIRK